MPSERPERHPAERLADGLPAALDAAFDEARNLGVPLAVALCREAGKVPGLLGLELPAVRELPVGIAYAEGVAISPVAPGMEGQPVECGQLNELVLRELSFFP